MRILHEMQIRKLHQEQGRDIVVEHDAFITKDGMKYIEDNGLVLMRLPAIPDNKDVNMCFSDVIDKKKKPEHITNLNAKVLVPKKHPRIMFRGKIDSFQANILEMQILAQKAGKKAVIHNLQEVLEYVRKILQAEVLEIPLKEMNLFGMNEEQLRYVSQHPMENFGINHMPPSYEMGEISIALNSLRATAREVELAAINAFTSGNKIERNDILQAMNRLSSALYILYLKSLSERKNLK
jgi:ethanolamine utilization cobalamin adenosyltransferase